METVIRQCEKWTDNEPGTFSGHENVVKYDLAESSYSIAAEPEVEYYRKQLE